MLKWGAELPEGTLGLVHLCLLYFVSRKNTVRVAEKARLTLGGWVARTRTPAS